MMEDNIVCRLLYMWLVVVILALMMIVLIDECPQQNIYRLTDQQKIPAAEILDSDSGNTAALTMLTNSHRGNAYLRIDSPATGDSTKMILLWPRCLPVLLLLLCDAVMLITFI